MTLDLSDEYVLGAMAAQEDEAAPGDPGLVVLDEPIEWKGTRYTELRLREPVTGEVLFATKVMGKRATSVTVRDAQLDLVGRVSGWPAAAIMMLPVTVQDDAIVFVTDFEENARRPLDEDPDRTPELRLLFSPPVEAVGRSHAEMLLREPRGDQRRRYDVTRERETPEATLQAEINLVADVADWQLAAVLKVPISKFARASDYLTGFFIRGPRTGRRSRPN
ncbi:phage tail assembly protein [Gluconacetobacter diazotrophicus]|uniref:Phage tail assembly protein n=1 Tax=Gluconacetobacter diazotrophicus TaxID=33996 RepID=A0A7W4NL03_GLUDI|nr:phage tail assembly protein [Gluconacetobacter diazotrophicus]MBB2157198.1 phage tail assembly protein [Gluconacetobacter diazotrophicus]